MIEDIFIPKSSSADALVYEPHTVTYVSSDKVSVDRAFTQGYGLQSSGWTTPDAKSRKQLNDYFDFDEGLLEYCVFYQKGLGANVQVRTFY